MEQIVQNEDHLEAICHSVGNPLHMLGMVVNSDFQQKTVKTTGESISNKINIHMCRRASISAIHSTVTTVHKRIKAFHREGVVGHPRIRIRRRPMPLIK